MSELPLHLYEGLVEELGDPEQAARGIDEFVIRWHAERLRERPPGGDSPG